MIIRIKRVYEPPSNEDGHRILVDRLWPRGLSKSEAKFHCWLKEIAPSTELRKWYGHDPEKWLEFKRRYFSELDAHTDAIKELLEIAREGTVTLVYSSKEQHLNNAFALKEYLESYPCSVRNPK